MMEIIQLNVVKHLNSKKYVNLKNKPAFLEFEAYRHLEHCSPNNDDSLNYRAVKEIKSGKKIYTKL